jgi:hypothetical protein
MRRPAPNEKPVADPSTEPNFYAIAEERPLPELKGSDEPEIMLEKPDMSAQSNEALQAQFAALQAAKSSANDDLKPLGELSYDNLFLEPLPVEQGTNNSSFQHQHLGQGFSQQQQQQPVGEVFYFGNHTFVSDGPSEPERKQLPQHQQMQAPPQPQQQQHHQHTCTCQCGSHLSQQPDFSIGAPVHDPTQGNLADEFDPLIIAQSSDFWAL